MGSVGERGRLRAVALSAERHHVGVLHGRAVGQSQRVGIVWIVASVTRDLTVIERHPLVKLVERFRRPVLRIGRSHAVTGRARNTADAAMRIGTG